MSTSEIIALCALAVSALMMLMNMRKGSQSDAAAQARQEERLSSISRGVDDIRLDMKSLKNEISAHTAKITGLTKSLLCTERRIRPMHIVKEINEINRKGGV